MMMLLGVERNSDLLSESRPGCETESLEIVKLGTVLLFLSVHQQRNAEPLGQERSCRTHTNSHMSPIMVLDRAKILQSEALQHRMLAFKLIDIMEKETTVMDMMKTEIIYTGLFSVRYKGFLVDACIKDFVERRMSAGLFGPDDMGLTVFINGLQVFHLRMPNFPSCWRGYTKRPKEGRAWQYCIWTAMVCKVWRTKKES